MKVKVLMNRLRRSILLLLLPVLLSACGESYSVPQATLHADLSSANQVDVYRKRIGNFLISKDFADLGIDEEMLSLYKSMLKREGIESMDPVVLDQIDRIQRTRSFRNREIGVDIDIVDLSDVSIKMLHARNSNSDVAFSDSPSLELRIYNFRPGGFSAEAHRLYKELLIFLESAGLGGVRIIMSPPETDQSEFLRISVINFISGILSWLVVYLCAIGVFGFIIIAALNLTRLNQGSKRLVFTILGTLLSTPLPFPAATILVILLPSAFALTAIGSDYFSRIQEFAVPSFIVSLVLSGLLSIRFIKHKQD